MKPHRSDDDLERLLADDGGEIGALYRRLPRAEPSPELDKAVLAHAASALRSSGKPSRASSRRRPRWLVGLGSAAGLVLAAGIAWQVGHDDSARAPAPAAEQPAAPVWIPVQPMAAPSPSLEPPPTAESAAEVSAVTAAPPPMKPSRAPAKAERAPSARAAAAPKPQVAEPAPPPSPPPPAPSAAPSAAPAAPMAPMTESASADRADEATALRERSAEPSAANAAESLSSTQARSAKRAAGAPSPNSSAELRRDLQLPPEQWIARIQQLQKLGRRQQAIESLRLFRRVHPDWQLPESLRSLDP